MTSVEVPTKRTAMDAELTDRPKPVDFNLSDELSVRLSTYYARLFPFEDFVEWLGYGDLKYFGRRELSFTLANDVYIRYQSFTSVQKFKEEVCKKNPEKMDIGAVFNYPPSDHNMYGDGVFQPQEKEIVIDIDMTDYDSVRLCCTGATVCTKCWQWLVGAVRCIDFLLRDAFGFKHMLWVYSGRRGIHCWISDERARKMNNQERGAVAEFLNIFRGGDHKDTLKGNPRMYPSHQEALDKHMEPIFVQHILPEQGILENSEAAKQLLAMIPDEQIQQDLYRTWFDKPCSLTSEVRWAQLKKTVQHVMSTMPQGTEKVRKLSCCVREIVIWYTYPRLDINVSKSLNHLLKSPFVIHPKTGRVCVPLDIDTIGEFDPVNDPPNLANLPEQINLFDLEHPDQKGKEDWEKTTMKKYILFFREEFLTPVLRELERKKEAERRQKRDQMDF